MFAIACILHDLGQFSFNCLELSTCYLGLYYIHILKGKEICFSLPFHQFVIIQILFSFKCVNFVLESCYEGLV